jgi:hypothetical protein
MGGEALPSPPMVSRQRIELNCRNKKGEADESFATEVSANRSRFVNLCRLDRSERGANRAAHGVLHRAGGFDGADVDRKGSGVF